AAARPELVREVVVVDITPGIDTSAGPAALREFYTVTDFASHDEAVERAMAFGFGGSREDTERGVFFNTRIRPDGRVEWRHHFAHLAAQVLASHTASSAASSAASDTAPATVGANDWADFAAVRSPLTLVRATRGFVTEADADDAQRRLPGARIVAIDATHNVQETAPQQLAALIRHATEPA